MSSKIRDIFYFFRKFNSIEYQKEKNEIMENFDNIVVLSTFSHEFIIQKYYRRLYFCAKESSILSKYGIEVFKFY